MVCIRLYCMASQYGVIDDNLTAKNVTVLDIKMNSYIMNALILPSDIPHRCNDHACG